MRVTYDHFFGLEETIDLQLVKLNLHLEGSREVEAVEQGWAMNEGVWYNCRSTRLAVNRYGDPKRIKGYVAQQTSTLTQDELSQVNEVYETFIQLKGFKKLYELMPNDPKTSWLLLRSDKIHAFTMFNEYDGALESNLTAWDYSNPKDSLGKRIVEYEIAVAKLKGYEHLYIGPGYGSSAVYKSKLKGFEWWTGSEWSTDVDKYSALCVRDDAVKTLEQLGKLYAEGNIV